MGFGLWPAEFPRLVLLRAVLVITESRLRTDYHSVELLTYFANISAQTKLFEKQFWSESEKRVRVREKFQKKVLNWNGKFWKVIPKRTSNEIFCARPVG